MPTFQSQRRGTGGIVAIPGKKFAAARPNFANILTVSAQPFRSYNRSTQAFTLSGTTKDSTGTPLPGCTVQLFRTNDEFFIAEVVSDGSGSYSFGVTAGPYYLVAYLPGATPLAGTTVNTLTGE